MNTTNSVQVTFMNGQQTFVESNNNSSSDFRKLRTRDGYGIAHTQPSIAEPMRKPNGENVRLRDISTMTRQQLVSPDNNGRTETVRALDVLRNNLPDDFF